VRNRLRFFKDLWARSLASAGLAASTRAAPRVTHPASSRREWWFLHTPDLGGERRDADQDYSGCSRGVGQDVESLALHVPAALAPHPTDVDLQQEARIATRQIANASRAEVVPAPVRSTTAAAERFLSAV